MNVTTNVATDRLSSPTSIAVPTVASGTVPAARPGMRRRGLAIAAIVMVGVAGTGTQAVAHDFVWGHHGRHAHVWSAGAPISAVSETASFARSGR